MTCIKACTQLQAPLTVPLKPVTKIASVLLQQQQPVRYWIDEYTFADGETALLRDSLQVPWHPYTLAPIESTSGG